ncbi:TRAP transporter small permease [Paracoccus tibetensis]|uniref:TRAP transporter small permease protein n=1 Tax=Paracoccus tibetensis TaxID=336292 RepID=A0A1G5BYL3_9RHOB|nr:TRAP transporter small permease subunit [Paracoccus tibetensis]SCX95285.1 TRAP-type C4-dicarboxylate transport system, small permease component [Paracoccus tibetensis]
MLAFLMREAEKLVCAILFLGMTLLGFANVVVRYGTSYSFASSEELLTNGFLLLTVFGAAIAARQGQHLAVTAVVDLLPRSLRLPLVVLSAALSVLLLLASAWLAWAALATLYANGLRSYALGIPAWYYQAAVPVAFLLIALRFVQHAVTEYRAAAAHD